MQTPDECASNACGPARPGITLSLRATTSDSEVRKPSSLSGAAYSDQDVRRHSAPDDCWLIVNNRVYDVTEFIAAHPGGPVILTYAGRDATDVFSTFHAATTRSQLKHFYIGDLQAQDRPLREPLRDFRRLRATMRQAGLFRSSKAFYAWKCSTNVCLLAASMAMLALAADSVILQAFSCMLLAVFWQQSGWLAHDFLHHQVFSARSLNIAAGYIIGNLLQGFSTDWWTSKHNKHHAAPNVLTSNNAAVDPDIDTLPLLAWDSSMLAAMPSGWLRGCMRWQHFYLVPVLVFARLVWAQQSLVHACRLAAVCTRGGLELVLIAAHYAWLLGAAFACLPMGRAFGWLLGAQMLAGLLLGLVFIQNHNGMEVCSQPKDFFTAQIVSTRNIHPSAWINWFTGGLNFQIEHHLFPSLPRHNLRAAQAPVMALCRKHGLAYEACGMTESMRRVLRCLAQVGRLA